MNQRKHTEIIEQRASILASAAGCNYAEQQAAKKAASNWYNEGSSGANSICQGVKVARRWRDQGIARVRSNILYFHQRPRAM